MKNLLKKIFPVFLLALLLASVFTSNDNKSNQFTIANIISINNASAEGGGDLVNCNCGLIWGKGCRADNYGATCASGDNCQSGNSNCSD